VRVLVTGAAGFAGRHLLDELAGAWPTAQVVPTARTADAARSLDPDLGVGCDLTDPNAVRTMVGQVRPDRVFHLAGHAATSTRDFDATRRANVDSTTNLALALRELGGDRWMLATGSGAVYGDTGPEAAATESRPLHAEGAYASSKAAMEEALRAAAGNGLRAVVARAFNHTGPGQMPGFAAPAFARQIARIRLGLDAPLLRVGNLAAVRDFLDVRDVVRAYRLLAESDYPGDFDIVNVSSGTGRRMSDLVDDLADRAGVAVTVEIDPGLFRPVDVAFSVGDSGKLAARTGFEPGVPWDRTLSDLLTEWTGREGGLVQGQNA